jgi:hypothetical protein
VLDDNQTRSLLQTDQQFPRISSQKKGIAIKPTRSPWCDKTWRPGVIEEV